MTNSSISAMINARVRKRKKVGNDIDNFAGYAFIAPWLIGFFVFAVGPIIASMYFSFTDYDLLSAPKWAGIANYIKMFSETRGTGMLFELLYIMFLRLSR
jgi:multiple sugar transport system permease protein